MYTSHSLRGSPGIVMYGCQPNAMGTSSWPVAWISVENVSDVARSVTLRSMRCSNGNAEKSTRRWSNSSEARIHASD